MYSFVVVLQATKFKDGEKKMYKWFIGQIMRETKGLADPNQVNAALCDALGCKLEDVADMLGSKQKKNKK